MKDEKPDPYYESWPDFTQGEDKVEAASRIAHSIEFMADPKLGHDAVQFMLIVAFGLKQATTETPYCVESETDDCKYYQVIRGSNGEYFSELSLPEAAGRPADEIQRAELEQLGWEIPNDESPNFHREYKVNTDIYVIAADAAKGWFKS